MTRVVPHLCLGLGLLGFFAGCAEPPEGVQGVAQGRSAADLLNSALATLKEDRPTVSTYRSAVQQLNNYLDQKRAELEPKFQLGKDERALIEGQLLAGLKRQQSAQLPILLNELEQKSFTLIDTYHLDACFLFRDAALALKNDLGPEPLGPDKEADRRDYQLRLARYAFEWVMRQVQLQPHPERTDRWPAHEILRRGTGDAEDRARVFLAMLEQLRLDGCMLTRTIEEQTDKGPTPRQIAWVPGVLIGQDIYVFETRLGVPVSGPEGRGTATLRELRANPKLIEALYPAEMSDRVTAQQVAKPAVWLPSNLPALAPRNRELQTWLANNDNAVVLSQDLSAALKRFREAKLDTDVRLWTNEVGLPAIVLPRFVENPRNEPRLQELLVPRRALIPDWVHEVAAKIGPTPGPQYLFNRFDSLFLSIRLLPTGMEEEVRVEQGQVKRARTPVGGVRDLLVRGRPEEAIERILDLEARLDKAMEYFRREPYPVPEMRNTWVPKLLEAEQALQALLVDRQKLDAQQAPAAARQQLDEQIRSQHRTVMGLWKEQERNLTYLGVEWALPEVREHLTYFMGLAKMELAVRAEIQAARPGARRTTVGVLTPAEHWGSAAHWFERYLAFVLPRPRNSWAQGAAIHLATCRNAQQRLTTSSK
jgi:hypothetical protein